MNLVNDPWIPVLMMDGRHKLFSLWQVYKKAETIRDLVATAPQRISLMRFIICITQAALDGPSDKKEWLLCKTKIRPLSIDYLSKYKEKFELFGGHSFLQPKSVVPTDNAVIDKLDFGLAAGNNHSLFDRAARPNGRSQSAAAPTNPGP